MSKTKHPSHYNEGKKLETWDWIEKGMTNEMFKGYLLGNCWKYLHRYESKGKGEDLKKAIEYIEKLDKFQYNKEKTFDKEMEFWVKRAGDGDLGVSAHALLKFVSGYTEKPTAHPHDDSDWRRCVSAINKIPYVSWLENLYRLPNYDGWKEYKKELVNLTKQRIKTVRRRKVK